MSFDFVLSDKLLAIYTNAIFNSDPGKGRGKSSLPIIRSEIQKIFADQLFGILIAQLRFERSDAEPVTRQMFGNNGVFEAAKEQVLGYFPIPDRKRDVFITQLEAELESYLLRSPPIEASWGWLGARDGQVIALLTPREKIEFTKATKKTLDIDL